MARSSYIYIVHNFLNDHILGAFTVKHEMETFVKQFTNRLTIYCERHRDNDPTYPPSAVRLK